MYLKQIQNAIILLSSPLSGQWWVTSHYCGQFPQPAAGRQRILEISIMGKLKIVFLSWGFVFKDFLWGFYLQRCRHREWRHGAWLCRPKLWEWRLRNWEIDRVIAWIPTIVEDARILILIFSKMWERRDPLCSSNDKNWQKYNFVRRVKMWENVQPFIFLKTIQLQHNMVQKSV